MGAPARAREMLLLWMLRPREARVLQRQSVLMQELTLLPVEVSFILGIVAALLELHGGHHCCRHHCSCRHPARDTPSPSSQAVTFTSEEKEEKDKEEGVAEGGGEEATTTVHSNAAATTDQGGKEGTAVGLGGSVLQGE